MAGPWQDSVERILGRRSNDRDRPASRQADYHRRGLTPNPPGTSSHETPDHGIDMPINTARSREELGRRLQEGGLGVHGRDFRVVREAGANQGTAPHYHIERLTGEWQPGPRARADSNRILAAAQGGGGVIQRRPREENPAGLPDDVLSAVMTAVDPGGTVTPALEAAALQESEDVVVVNGQQVRTPPAEPGMPPERPESIGPMPQGTERGTRIADPYAGEAQLSARFGYADAQAIHADDVVSHAINEIQTTQDQRVTAATERAAATGAINEEIRDRTERVIGEMRPLFASRTALADRERELALMNPLERGIMSLFDASYDRGTIRQVSGAVENQLQARAQEYGQITDLQNTIMNLIDRQYQAEDLVAALGIEGAEQDMQLATRAFQSAQAMLEAGGAGIAAQMQTNQAQIQVRQEVLGRLTLGEAQSLQNRVDPATGEVEFQGAIISDNDLNQVIQNHQLQAMEFERSRISTEIARRENSKSAIELQLFHQNRAIGTMTTPQLREAIANGGRYRGQQFDLRMLGEGLQQSEARDTQMLGAVNGGDINQQLHTVNRQLRTQVSQYTQRVRELTGVVPPELQQELQNITVTVQRMTADRERARAMGPGVFEQWNRQNLERYIQMQQSLQGRMGTIAERWAGGNRQLLPLAQAYLQGQPLSGPAAIDGLIELVRTGQGGNLRGPARIAFDRARAVMQQVEQQNGGTSIEQMMQRPNAAQLRNQLREQVGRAVSDAYNNQFFGQLLPAATQIAGAINHPAGQINPDTWRAAIATGDAEAYRVVAGQLGINADQARAMFEREGTRSPTWQRLAGTAGRVNVNGTEMDFGQLQQLIAQTQQIQTFRALDASSPTIGGQRPSTLMVSLLNDQNFQQRASSIAAISSQSSMGGYVMHSITGGSFSGQLADYGNVARLAAMQGNVQSTQAAMRSVSRYGTDPSYRAQIVLNAIFENPDDARRLGAAVQQHVAERGSPSAYDRGLAGDGRSLFTDRTHLATPAERANELGWSQMRDVIMNQSFQDPGLERLRRTAAQGLDTAVATADRMTRAMMDE